MARPIQRHDTKDDFKLFEYLKEREQEITDLKKKIDTLSKSPVQQTFAQTSNAAVRLDPRTIFAIRDALSAGGIAELPLDALPGVTGQPQYALIPRVSVLPDPYATLYSLVVVTSSGSTPDTLWVLQKDVNPYSWKQIATTPSDMMTTDTVQDVGPNARKDFHDTLYSQMGSGTEPDWTAALVNYVAWLTGNSAAFNFYRDNAAGANLAANDLVSLISTYGMCNAAYALLSYILTSYTGNGTNSKSAMYFATSDGTTIQPRLGLDELGRHIVYANNGADVITGYNTEQTTLNGATTDSAANLLQPNSILKGIVLYVTTTITGCTSVNVGDPTSATRFGNLGSLAAGSGLVALNHWQGGVATNALGPVQFAADKIRYAAVGGGGTFTAGVIRAVAFYERYDPPTS